MSNEMNNEHDKTSEQEVQQKLSKASKDASEETTSSALDDSIMAMAQQEVDAREKAKSQKSWWDRLKMPVSLTAALVVTVGIARFMVELGYHQPEAMSSEAMSQTANSAQTYERKTEVVLRDEAFAENDLGKTERAVAAAPVPVPTPAPEKRVASEQEENIAVISLRTNAEEIERARRAAEYERQLAQAKVAYKKEQQLMEQQHREALALENTTGSDNEKALEPEENQAVASDVEVNSGQAEAVETPYLPATEWLEQIETLLKDDKTDAAKEQWLEFKQVYPDYSVEKQLFQRLEGL